MNLTRQLFKIQIGHSTESCISKRSVDQKAKFGPSIAKNIDKLSKNQSSVTCAFTFCVQMPLATQEHIFIVVKTLFYSSNAVVQSSKWQYLDDDNF